MRSSAAFIYTWRWRHAWPATPCLHFGCYESILFVIFKITIIRWVLLSPTVFLSEKKVGTFLLCMQCSRGQFEQNLFSQRSDTVYYLSLLESDAAWTLYALYTMVSPVFPSIF